MTDNNQQDTGESGETNRATLKRRDVIGVLAATGGLAAVGASQSGASGGTGIGGGPMSSGAAHLQVEVIQGEFSERPSAGVENRVFRVDDLADSRHGNVYKDDGGSWDLIELGVGALDTEVAGTGHSMLSESFNGTGSTTSTSFTSLFNNNHKDPLLLGGLPSGWKWEVAYSVTMSNDTSGESCTSKPQFGYWNGDPDTELSYNTNVVNAAEVTVTTTADLSRVWSGWVDPGFGNEPTMVDFREIKAKVSDGTSTFENPGYAFRAVEK